jgi:hypothetical protein
MAFNNKGPCKEAFITLWGCILVSTEALKYYETSGGSLIQTNK